MLAGNVVALLSPIIFIPVLTYAFGPQNYDFVSMAAIRLADDAGLPADPELAPAAALGLSPEETEKERALLARSSLIAKSLTGIMTLALLVLWPMPMYGSGYVFSKPFFTGWVVVGILWLFGSAGAVGLYPLWEGRGSMAQTFGGIWRDLTGKGGRRREGVVVEGEEVVGKGSRDGSLRDDEVKVAEAMDEKK